MQKFTYCVPTEVIFGKGTEQETGMAVKAHGGSKVLVLYGGGSAVRSGLVDRVTDSLTKAGLEFIVKGGVHANPILSFVHETLDLCKGQGVDFILGVGGGSVLDTAKAVGMGLGDPEAGEVWDFFQGIRDPKCGLPIGAVLTIAAAGSETSDSAVITNQDTHEKRGRNTPFNRPAFAIMNPELTMTLPARQTACGVADIMMHTMERYFSRQCGNATSDAIAEAVLRTTIQYGAIAMEKPDNYEARSEVMWCGSLSHNDLTGLGQMKDFSVHQLGHELSGRYDLPHGESLTAMWSTWARYVMDTNPARFAQYARNVFGITETDDVEAAKMGIQATEDYFKNDLHMPVTIGQTEAGVIDEESIQILSTGCSRGNTRRVGNFHPIKEEHMVEIYKLANH